MVRSAAVLTTVFFWLIHVPSFYVETRSWATTALVLGIFLLPHLGSRFITGWLYNSAGSSVLIAVTILYGLAPLRALAQNWLLLFTVFLPALAIMIVLNNVAEEIGWTVFVFARFQDRHGPLRAAVLTTVFFWLIHVTSFYVETRSWATTALVLGIFLLPQLGSRLITGWLYNGASFSVLIAGLFHSMHNAM